MIALYHQYSFVLPIPGSIEEEEKERNIKNEKEKNVREKTTN